MNGTYTLTLIGDRVEVRDGCELVPHDIARRVIDAASQRLWHQAPGGVIAPPAAAGPPLPEGPRS